MNGAAMAEQSVYEIPAQKEDIDNPRPRDGDIYFSYKRLNFS
jgi:hypothetical protein